MSLLVAALLSSSLVPPPLLTRRAVLAAPAAMLAPLAAVAVGDNKVGYNNGDGMTESAAKAFTESSVAGKAEIRLNGKYTDKASGLPRKVLLQGGGAIITGANEDGKKFTLKGTPNGKALYIDFSPAGGPKTVRTEWNGLGLVFPDGNFWTKLP